MFFFLVAKIISDRFMDLGCLVALPFNGPSSGSCSTFGITACYLEGRGGGPFSGGCLWRCWF